jgi:membrane carboxypeptidase/penicillin-binding protein PbpC
VETQTPLFWYLDGVFLGKSTPETPVIMRLESGNHSLACMASSGAIDKVAFNVDAPYTKAKLQTR